MKADFSQEENVILRGQSSKLANKHSCSAVYVNYIINGKRNINTIKAKAIYKDLNKLLTLLKPDNNEK